MKKHQIGIALSGGGTRGVVHIGALKALEESGIYPSIVAGTSAGSIVGVLYAHGYTSAEILSIASERSLIWMFSLRLPTSGFVRHTFLRKMLTRYVPEKQFEELAKPLYVAISNLNTGRPEVRSAGELHEVIIASASIPIMYEPIRLGDHYFSDGGLLMNLPISPIRSQADIVIAVNLIPRIELSAGDVTTIAGIASRCLNLAAINTIRPEIDLADVVIEPGEIYSYSRFNFTHIKEMHEIGYRETMKQIPEIKEKIKDLHNVRSAPEPLKGE